MRLLTVLGFLMLTACPTGSTEMGPNKTCDKQFEKCKLPGGPLGICDRRACKDGETPPCLVCMPQH